MTGLTLTFIVVFVLVVAAICALLVLRMLGTLELPQSPPFPHRHTRAWHHPHTAAHDGTVAPSPIEEELAGKH